MRKCDFLVIAPLSSNHAPNNNSNESQINIIASLQPGIRENHTLFFFRFMTKVKGIEKGEILYADNTSSSPNILYMIAAGVFNDGSPSGRPRTARKCCSYCEV